MYKCTICGTVGEVGKCCGDDTRVLVGEDCQACQDEQQTVKRLKFEIKQTKRKLFDLQQQYLKLTGGQYFG